MSTPLDTTRTAAAAALAAASHLVPDWLPEGTCKGAEWVATNPVRGDRAAGSFSVNLNSGKWNDFADQQARGRDLVALLAYLRNTDQLTAAREIFHILGLQPLDQETPAQRERRAALQAEQQERRERAERQAQEAQEQAQAKARHNAQRMWHKSTRTDPSHPYLHKKKVLPYNTRQNVHGSLVIPLHIGETLHNLQIITRGGEKRFLTGGRVKGCYCQIGAHAPEKPLYICEGWATGATLHANSGCTVFCAMSAGNLLEVARYIREKANPERQIIIAGDDDRRTRGNPGRTAAIDAARAINAMVVFPEWPDDAPAHLSDFNDLHCWIADLDQEGEA